MLYLTFHLGPDRFAIRAARIAEVLPLVRLRPIPHALPSIAGIFDFHGVLVPVLDLCAATTGQPAITQRSTRLIVIHYEGKKESHLLGILAERVTDVLRRESGEFRPTGVSAPAAPYLGGTIPGHGGMIQEIDLEKLIPAEVAEILFANVVEPIT